MKLLTIILLISSILGCANTIPKFSDTELNSGNLTFIKAEEFPFFYSGFRPSIHSVYNKNNEEIARAGFYNRIGELQLTPGYYHIVLLCDSGNAYAHPSIQATLLPNTQYELSCEITERGKSLLGSETIESLGATIRKINNEEIAL